MANPDRGEVWLVDLGTAAKIRPCLVLSIPPNEETDRVLVTVIAHTTSPRGSRFEVSVPLHFLKAGVFDAQNLVTIPMVKLMASSNSRVQPTGDRGPGLFDTVRSDAAVPGNWS